MWQLQPILAWLSTVQGSNLTFAVLCGLLMCGAPPRLMLALTIALHVCLAFM
jgi:hypothetical protein